MVAHDDIRVVEHWGKPFTTNLIAFNLDPECGVTEAHPIPSSWAKHRDIRIPADIRILRYL